MYLCGMPLNMDKRVTLCSVQQAALSDHSFVLKKRTRKAIDMNGQT